MVARMGKEFQPVSCALIILANKKSIFGDENIQKNAFLGMNFPPPRYQVPFRKKRFCVFITSSEIYQTLNYYLIH